MTGPVPRRCQHPSRKVKQAEAVNVNGIPQGLEQAVARSLNPLDPLRPTEPLYNMWPDSAQVRTVEVVQESHDQAPALRRNYSCDPLDFTGAGVVQKMGGKNKCRAP